jgi:broad specificity phosphatase PhoE
MIYLARHGETTWNLAGRYQGRLESALTSRGLAQAYALADRIATGAHQGEMAPTRVVSSPLLRCTATALPIAQRLDLTLETDERLIEIGHGTWEGRYRDDLAANDADVYFAWRNAPETVRFDGGESLADVATRWRDFAASLARTNDDIVVVTHDAVIRIAVLVAQDRPLAEFWSVQAENAAYATFAPDRPSWTLIEECNADHLGTGRSEVGSQAL